MSFVSDHVASLPRPLAVALTVSGFLFLINVFSGLHTIWFHWPAAALLFIGIMRTVLQNRPPSDKSERRQTRQD